MKIDLVMTKGDGSRKTFPVTKDRVVIGRTNTADLRVPLPSVSRKHCEIWVEGDKIKLRDLGSSNGTLHNSKRVQEAVLAAGDEITVGPISFVVLVDGRGGTGYKSSASSSLANSAVPTPRPQRKSQVDEDEEMLLIAEEHKETPALFNTDDPISALEAMDLPDDDLDDLPIAEPDEPLDPPANR